MRIAVFSLAYSPFVGGAELAIKEITDRITEHDFFCFTHKFERGWPVEERIGNVKIFRLGSGGYNLWQKFFYVFQAWRAAEKEHRRQPIDVIWAMMAAYGGLAALLFKLHHPRIPMLLTLQEGDSEEHILRRVGIFYPLWRWIFKKADRIQAISNYLADFARKHGARCPIEVVPNGVDIKKFQINSLPAGDYPKGNKSQNLNIKIIITTSRLVYKNGIDTLISAVAELKKLQAAGYRLQVLGIGPDEQKLKNLAVELGVADNIQFFGYIDPEKISEYLMAADIFVRPSRSEGLGSSFLEAMAAGLPIIGTPVGGIPDFLEEYNENHAKNYANNTGKPNGLFVKVNDHKALADKVVLLLKDDQLRKKLGENGRQLVFENYSWDKISGKMSQIFDRLMIKDKRLKILLVTGIYPPEIGGPATYAVLVEKELPKRGIAVRVLPFRVVRRWPVGIRHFLYFLKSFRRALGQDAIFAQDTISVGLPAMLAAKILRKSFIIRVPGDYVWEQSVQRFGVKDSIDDFQSKKYSWRIELMRRIQKWVTSSADIVITPSNYFRDLVRGWVRNKDKVRVIYNGIDLATSAIRHVKGGEKLIISAGRLVPWKGFDVLIELMKDLPNWKLVIVGDGPEKRNLDSIIQNLELRDRVILAGAISREELLNYLYQARVFVLNTSFESFSFQVVEAMSTGVPVVTTNIGNLAEIIENGKEGILVEPNNKEQILMAIKKFDEDQNFRDMIIINARKKSQEFSIERTIEALVKTFNTLHY